MYSFTTSTPPTSTRAINKNFQSSVNKVTMYIFLLYHTVIQSITLEPITFFFKFSMTNGNVFKKNWHSCPSDYSSNFYLLEITSTAPTWKTLNCNQLTTRSTVALLSLPLSCWCRTIMYRRACFSKCFIRTLHVTFKMNKYTANKTSRRFEILRIQLFRT